ncbi:MAG: CHASE2 domain-containing protein [Treponema sp.]|nr:CHASE2 domain-containing protein [Treponema sp.]
MKKYLSFLIAVIAIAVCSLVYFSNIDNKINDVFLRTAHPLEESEDVVVLLVDDESIEKVGTFPWNRNVYGDAILNARELGASQVVFDLSFLDPSTRSADPDYVDNELPGYIDQSFALINEAAFQVLEASGGKEYTLDELKEAFAMASEEVKNQVMTNVQYVVTDNDASLGASLAAFGDSFLTLDFENTDEDEESGLAPYDRYYLATRVALQNIDASEDTITPSYNKMMPALDSLLKSARSAGFVNADPDKDGIRRRLHLVYKHDGVYYGQLAFVPLLERLGNPEVIITNKSFTLKDAKISETETKDIVIPRCEDGSVLIKFPKKKFVGDETKGDKGYKRRSFGSLYELRFKEKPLVLNLKILEDAGVFYDLGYETTPYELYGQTNYIREALLEGEDDEITFDLYREYRTAFYDSVGEFLSDETKEFLLDFYSDDDELCSSIEEIYGEMKVSYDSLVALREKIRSEIDGAMLIVGTCATSTTDYGNIIYEENYPNVGVHSVIANMILSEDFVDDSPFWISIFIAIIICFAYCFASMRLSTGKSLIVGGSLLIVLTFALWAFFMVSNTYIGSFVPVVSLFLTFVASAVIGYLNASHEKRFIQGAFSQCLSPDVVKDIVDHPENLKLGGESRFMSAIFTDIQKFSGFSELLNAAELVALLNYYLTPMSDIIMEEGGMVDKYEGDAIVALVGAPTLMEDHAARAVRAAIRMKNYEKELNKKIVKFAAMDFESLPAEEKISEELHSAFKKLIAGKRNIFTRIGVNSGEMVAGFMGSDAKKNYTMMGNNVNLASRLEGVNKQYSTGGILISQATREHLGDDFVVRPLDRVQVVNVKTPMRLYEVLAIKADADENLLKSVAYWEEAMKTFESGDYAKALEMFQKCVEENGDDKVAKYYAELTGRFFVNGTYPKANDDFGVVYNSENPADMDPTWIGTDKEIKGTFTLLSK